jgi:molecular chaperone DnaK
MTNTNRKEKIVGIDLGTSNSAASVLIAGKPVIIPAAEGTTIGGGKAFPSFVAFTKDKKTLVGEPARRQAISNPERTVTAIKRKMGTDYKLEIDGKKYTPQEISAMILQKIKADTEAFLNEPINKAVITVPAYFNDAQRTATKDAGRIAGLEVVRIINEPTAAALAYGLDKKDHNAKVAVLDLGGGTFDVTIMELNEGVFEVISTSGDTQLGGTDMDRLIMEDLAQEFKRKNNIDLLTDPTAKRRLLEGAEKAKIELSNLYSTQVNLPFITQDASGPKHMDMEYTRARLEEVIAPVLDRLDAPMKRALKDAKFESKDIDKVILIGGPTRMPSVLERFERVFDKKAEHGVDPMEAVAIGAGIQGAVLGGDVKDILLLDVTPLTLGVETLGEAFTPLVDRNTTVPVKKSKVFSTASDNQTSVEIHVMQGERPKARDNFSLGKFYLDGIPPAPRGLPQIEVTFEINENGILEVTAKDLGTGKDKSIRIEGTKKLSEEEISRMQGDAERNKEADEKFRETTQKRNELDSMTYQAEKLMKENAGKLEASLRDTLVKAMDAARDVVKTKGDNLRAIEEAKAELEKPLHEFAQHLYSSKDGASAQPGEGPDVGPSYGAGGTEGTGSDDNAVDAEYS